MSRIIIITPPPPPPGSGAGPVAESRNAELLNDAEAAQALEYLQSAIESGARIRIVDTHE